MDEVGKDYSMTLNFFRINPTPARVSILKIICERLDRRFSMYEVFKEVENQGLNHSTGVVIGTLGLFKTRGLIEQVTTGTLGERETKLVCTI